MRKRRMETGQEVYRVSVKIASFGGGSHVTLGHPDALYAILCDFFFALDRGMLPSFMIQHLEGDCRQVLPSLPAKSVHACISSPPYWRKRSYLAVDHPSKPLEIGQESTVRQYIDTLVGVFRQVARVLVSNGTLWLNIGDSYADKDSASAAGVKNGDLVGLPWRLAMGLQADGWLLRSSIVWANDCAS